MVFFCPYYFLRLIEKSPTRLSINFIKSNNSDARKFFFYGEIISRHGVY